MLELTTIPDIRAWTRAQRAAGRRIGWCLPWDISTRVTWLWWTRPGGGPTRGADHLREPAAVRPREDLARYPRDLPRDRSLAASRGVDTFFVPRASDMYPPGSEVRVMPGATAERWEGAARPGHFTGVLTVVAKLFI